MSSRRWSSAAMTASMNMRRTSWPSSMTRRSGIRPPGLTDFLQTMIGDTTTASGKGWFKTHPSAEQRLEKAKDRISALASAPRKAPVRTTEVRAEHRQDEIGRQPVDHAQRLGIAAAQKARPRLLGRTRRPGLRASASRPGHRPAAGVEILGREAPAPGQAVAGQPGHRHLPHRPVQPRLTTKNRGASLALAPADLFRRDRLSSDRRGQSRLFRPDLQRELPCRSRG